MPTTVQILNSIKGIFQQPELPDHASFTQFAAQLNSNPDAWPEIFANIHDLFVDPENRIHPDWYSLDPHDLLIAVALANLQNPHAQKFLLTVDWEMKVQIGPKQNSCIALVMVDCEEGWELIEEDARFLERLLAVDWNIAYPNDPGKTIAWCIMNTAACKIAYFSGVFDNVQFQNKLLNVDWRSAPVSELPLGFLILSQSRDTLIQNYYLPDTFIKRVKFNEVMFQWLKQADWLQQWDGLTIAICLLDSDIAFDEFKNNKLLQDKLLCSDWDVRDDVSDRSVAQMALDHEVLVELFANNITFRQKLLSLNWDIKYGDTEDVDDRFSIAEEIAHSPTTFLKFAKQDDLLIKFVQADWQCDHPRFGLWITSSIAWMLLDDATLLDELTTNAKLKAKFLQLDWIKQYPVPNKPGAITTLLDRIVGILQLGYRGLIEWFVTDQRATTRLEKYLHTAINSEPSLSLVNHLALANSGQKIFRSAPRLLFLYYQSLTNETNSLLGQFVATNNQELITAALLLHANYYHPDIPTEKRGDLDRKYQQIKTVMQRVVAIWESMSQNLTIGKLAINAIITRVFLAELPECQHLVPHIEYIIAFYVGYPTESNFDMLAVVFVHQYRRYHVNAITTQEQKEMCMQNMRQQIDALDSYYRDALLTNIEARRQFVHELVQRPSLDVQEIQKAFQQDQAAFQSNNHFLYLGHGAPLQVTETQARELTKEELREKRLRFFTEFGFSQPVRAVCGKREGAEAELDDYDSFKKAGTADQPDDLEDESLAALSA